MRVRAVVLKKMVFVKGKKNRGEHEERECTRDDAEERRGKKIRREK